MQKNTHTDPTAQLFAEVEKLHSQIKQMKLSAIAADLKSRLECAGLADAAARADSLVEAVTASESLIEHLTATAECYPAAELEALWAALDAAEKKCRANRDYTDWQDHKRRFVLRRVYAAAVAAAHEAIACPNIED
jgi:hypothetical protein